MTGIARLYVQTWDDKDVELYVTPININPGQPVMPISHPFVYSIYLAKTLGLYATLGLAEDTWALNERVIDEEAFLKQSWLICEERKQQLWDVLDKTRRASSRSSSTPPTASATCSIASSIPRTRRTAGKDGGAKYKHVIPETYAEMDKLVGELVARSATIPRRS
jgi:hypothetical protein